jgi:hypothetical protein
MHIIRTKGHLHWGKKEKKKKKEGKKERKKEDAYLQLGSDCSNE